MTNTNSGPQANILLAEDNPGGLHLTEKPFKSGGTCNPLHVTRDGMEALESLQHRGEYDDAPRPDIVLLDLNLPRLDGDEVLEEIRADPELSHLPVIILTSSSAESDIVRSYELQAKAYLTKPVDLTEFIDTIRSFMQFWLSVVQLPPCTDP